MKKILLIIILLMLLITIGLSVFARKAPDFVVSVLEGNFHKDIEIASIGYSFPMSFDIQDLTVRERGEYEGEVSITLDSMTARLEPIALLNKRIIFNYIELNKPQIVFRKKTGSVIHPLSSASMSEDNRVDGPKSEATIDGVENPETSIPIHVHRLNINDGVVKFIDYDADLTGFVHLLHRVNATISNYKSDDNDSPIHLKIDGVLSQGRGVEPVDVHLEGSYADSTLETNMVLNFNGLWLPYYKVYYQEYFPSEVMDGLVAVESQTHIRNKVLNTNAKMNVRRLSLSESGEGDQLFGVDVQSILDVLRNNANQINLDLVIERNLDDPSETFEDALRNALQKSLKATFFSNIENIVSNTLEKIVQEGKTEFEDGEEGGLLSKKTLKKVLNSFLESSE